MRTLLALGGALVLLLAGCGGGGLEGGLDADPSLNTFDPPEEMVVTNLQDAGLGSLRHAIQTVAEGGEIRFAAGLSGTIRLASGELVLTKDVRILGPGATSIIVSGGGTQRAFHVRFGPRVLIRGLTIAEGLAGSTGGGGVRNLGILTLEEVVVAFCHSDHGGGIATLAGGRLTVLDSTVRGCSALRGGAIANALRGMLIERSTLSHNLTTGNVGGAIYNDSADVTIINSTLSGNATTGDSRGGSAVFCESRSDDSVLRILSSTITANQATGSGAITLIGDEDARSTLELRATIVAGNQAQGLVPDIDAFDAIVVSGGFNLVGDGAGSGLVNGLNGDKVGGAIALLPPLLGPLASHGGPTQTHLPLAASPAVDAVPPQECQDAEGNPLLIDQRLAPRPQGTACDIGATESAPAPPPVVD